MTLMQEYIDIDFSEVLSPIITIIIFVILMGLMITFFRKKRIFLIILTIHLFSLIIGFSALNIPNFPFTPWFQVFFIIFQTMFLLISSYEVYKYGKGA